jgi:hypothetical protein
MVLAHGWGQPGVFDFPRSNRQQDGMMQPEHLMAILRGWYPHWQMELRVFTSHEQILLALLCLVCLNTIWSLNRKGER